MSLKKIIGYILLSILSIGLLALCFCAFFDCGYSILQLVIFALIICVRVGAIVGLAYLFVWLFD